ncbi:MAG: hypothetical protein WA441_08825 [Methyloceanibacter sp.]
MTSVSTSVRSGLLELLEDGEHAVAVANVEALAWLRREQVEDGADELGD